MELDNIKKVYFVGIGGIGMSALARYFSKRGCLVAGYDRTETPLTKSLVEEGIFVTYVDQVGEILSEFEASTEELLIVYTPAIPSDSPILTYFKEGDFSVKKRSQVLGIISKGMFTVAVAGTHGKTTTSTLIAHILTHSGFGCTAFLGGISSNYNKNVLFGDNDVVVVEADEYDRSFLQLHPNIAVVTSTDADHLDIYGNADSVKDSFRLFVGQIKEGGTLIEKEGLELGKGVTYSACSVSAISHADNVRVENGSFHFDFVNATITIKDILMPLPGLHNVENAVAAIEVGLLLGIAPEKIRASVAAFKGIKRRFEFIVRNEKVVYVDDYAHHPQELNACIAAVKRLYPEKKLTVIFQPHLFSRTRDFADGFAEALSAADDLLLLDIYPARELPIEGVSSELLLDKTTASVKTLCSKSNVLDLIKEKQPELLLTVGAGDIDTLVEPLKKLLGDA